MVRQRHCVLIPWGAFFAVKFLALILSISFQPISCRDANGDDLPDQDLKLVKALESQRISAIDAVIGSVIAIYDEDRQGGGSGVIIDPAGIALTNHHVIIGAGVSGLGWVGRWHNSITGSWLELILAAMWRSFKWKAVTIFRSRRWAIPTMFGSAIGPWRWGIRLF